MVAHSGNSSTSGHYISYVRDPARTGSWIEVDDSEIRDINVEEINHNLKPTTQGMLPYIMAWELIDLSKEGEAALATRLETLNEKEEELRIRQEALDEENKKLMKWAGHENNRRSPSVQPAVRATEQIAHELDEGKDTATFCATFRNAENHGDNARAIFKLSNFNPNVPTKIESTVQLTDLGGNLRSIKKGTTVNDNFIIIFNVKGGKKRKRDDDDEAGPPPPVSKKTKRPPKKANKLRTPPRGNKDPQTSPKGNNGSPVAQKSTISPKANERQSPKTGEAISRKSPPAPRRSTRVNKGKNPKRA